MTPIELYMLIRAWLIIGQAVYWYLMHDDGRDAIVWNACLYPGEANR